MKKIILHYTNRPYSIEAGGVETYMINLINGTKNDFNHIFIDSHIGKVIETGTGLPFIDLNNYYGEVSSSKDRIKQVLLFPLTLLVSCYQIIKYYELFKSADIISYTTGSRNSILNFAPIVRLFFPKKRQIYVHHGAIPSARIYEKGITKSIFVWGWNQLENVFICNSQKQLFADYGIKNGTMIYNSINMNPKVSITREGEIFKILFVARLVIEKGVLDTFEALKILDKEGVRLQFDVLGDGPLKNEIQKFKFKNIIVNIWGKQNPVEFYKKANCHVFPSYHPEGFGLTLIEAMCFGLPTIYTKLPPFVEIMQKLPELAIDIKSPQQIADKIKLVMQNRQKYSSLEYQTMLIQEFKARFSNQKHIQQYIAFYNK